MWFSKETLLTLFFVFLLGFGELSAAEKFSRSVLCGYKSVSPNSEKVIKNRSGDRWFGRDKGLHFVGSMISTVAVGKTSQTFWGQSTDKSVKIGAGFTFALGLGKEVWDSTKKNNKFSYKDLTADILGILTGSILLNLE